MNQYLNTVLQHLRSGDTVLNLGCKNGAPVADFLIQNHLKVVGVDPSSEMLFMAKQKHPSQTWIHSKITKPQVKQKFEAIVCWMSLSLLSTDDQKSMFNIFEKHICAEGILLFTLKDEHLNSEVVYQLLGQHHFEKIRYFPNASECGKESVWIAETRGQQV